jgi:cell wall-associated NlpC family hydrolase
MTSNLPGSTGAFLLSVFSTLFTIQATALAAYTGGPDNSTPAYVAAPDLEQSREQIAGYAQQFTGLKYRYAGRSPQTGFDCSGFTNFVLKEFDVKVSSSSSTQSLQGARIPLDQVKPGDLVFFGRSGRGIQHVAMVVERNEKGIFCVHSTCTRGVVVENILESSYWRPRILYARDVITQQKAPLGFPE